MDAEIQKKLREKFDTAQIGLKPKITCKACSDSRSKACDKHQKAACNSLRGGPGCGQWITPAHMHIEFVGHANVTDRLLAVDPEWTWEPVAFAPDGLPALTKDGGLWIRLTVAGVTRIGYGGADGKTGDDAVKEAVSDAIKVTAMRFGVALDLWRKEEASGKAADETGGSETGGNAPSNGRQQPRNGAQNGRQTSQQDKPAPAADHAPEPAQEGANPAALAVVQAACNDNGWDRQKVTDRYEAQFSEPIAALKSVPRAKAFVKLLDGATDLAAAAPATNGAQV